MATVYSSEVSVGTYNRIRIKCDYSGTSATLTVQFRRTSSYTTTWSDTQATLTLGGTEKAAAYNYTGTVGESWVDLRPAISGYTISTSGGTYNWVFNNPGSSSVLGCSGTITIPAQSTPPTDLAISNISSTTNTVTATVSVSSWGGAGDANSRYRNLSVLETSDKSTSPRRYERVYGNTMSSAITVDNNTQYGSMTIQPNTRYWLWWYATNGTDGVSSPDTSTTTVVTLPEAATVSLSSVTTTSVTISFSTAADGGYYTKWVQYSRDNGNTWVTAYNVTTGSATSGTFTVTGLIPGTNYTFKTRVATTAGNTNGSDVTFTTTSIIPPDGPKLYGSASNQTTKVIDLYGSVNSATKRITKLYGSANGQTKLTYQGFGHVDYGYGYVLYYTDSNHTSANMVMISSTAELNALGNSSTSWSATIGGTPIPNTDIITVHLTNKVTSLPEHFLRGCSVLEEVDIANTSITAIPRNFLSVCAVFNMPIVIPNQVTSIGNNFLMNSDSFNQPILIPQAVSSIGSAFLQNCDGFNQDITLPSSLTALGGYFLEGAKNMTSTVNVGALDPAIVGTPYADFVSSSSSSAPMYTTGVKIAGSNRAAWLTKFPNHTDFPYYRNLIDAGY